MVRVREYVQRSIEPYLVQAMRDFAAVVLTGPRQSGKTTMLRESLGDSHRYVSLDAPDIRAAAMTDPRGFLAAFSPPVFIDEVQHAPHLLSYIKERIDADRDRKGQYILSGSQNLLLSEKVNETLAGRAAMLKLLPLTMREQAAQPAKPLPWEDGGHDRPCAAPLKHHESLWRLITRGSYPELTREPDRDALLWQASYAQTYLERDVRGIRQVGDLGGFQAFLRAIAARTGQLLNLAEVSRDIGVSHATGRAWLSVLDATYQVLLLRPYYANIGKRLVKTPKVYLTDTGLACYLLGMTAPEHAANGPMRGQLFETLVVGEIYKTLLHRGTEPRIHFWRTATGVEVDLLVETPHGLVPVETKVSATPRPEMGNTIRRLRADLGPAVLPGHVVHAGDLELPLGDEIRAIPYWRL